MLRALRDCFRLPLDEVGLAMLAHRVETDFVGAPVGTMDQMACALADESHVLFLDTRVGGCGNYALVRDLREAIDDASRLIIAMSGFLPEEPIARLRDAGYDGHCRRPCPVWQMTDLLDEFFACHAVR